MSHPDVRNKVRAAGELAEGHGGGKWRAPCSPCGPGLLT